MSFTRKLRKIFVKVATKAKRIKDFALHKDPIDAIVSEVRNARPEPALENRVVVITGSSGGIGLVLAEAFLQKGARVVINGRRADVLQAAVKQTRRGKPGARSLCRRINTARSAGAP